MFSPEFVAKINAQLVSDKPLSCVGCVAKGTGCAGCSMVEKD